MLIAKTFGFDICLGFNFISLSSWTIAHSSIARIDLPHQQYEYTTVEGGHKDGSVEIEIDVQQYLIYNTRFATLMSHSRRRPHQMVQIESTSTIDS